MRKGKDLGVQWYLPGQKKSFTSTTKATSDLIVYLAEDTGETVTQIKNAIQFDDEAVAVLVVFEEHGYGETILKTLVK